ncbi:MAG: hypothetical protein ACRDP9_25815 [Kribbellaceae bacterium]
MPDPMNAMLGRFGYIRRDELAATTVAIPDETQAPAPYPQVVMIQDHSTGESWVRDHAGQLLVGAGVAVLGLAALAVVALVVVAVAVAAVCCVAALAVASAATASLSSPRGKGRR